jgi:hypothetical protein
MPLIKLFFDICLFKKGPQDLPASGLLLGLATLAYLLVGIVLLGLEATWADAAIQALVEGAMLLGFLFITLKVTGLMSRFLQTASAMLGCDALISSLAVPLLTWMLTSPEAKGVYLFLLLLMLWHLAVVAHILRHALSRHLGIGLGLAIVYVVASYQVMLLLFAPSA